MNAIDFLIKEHNKVRGMFADLTEEPHQFDTIKKRFELLANELIRHENMEHEVWYPYFKDALPDSVKHLLKEEKGAEKEIEKIKGLQTEAAWSAHLEKLKQDVEHHASEEENDLFPEVQNILSEKQLMDIGAEMLVYKREHL